MSSQDPSRCGVCYPVVVGSIWVHFEGEDRVKYALRGWRRCSNEGETFTDPVTKFVHTQCKEHLGTCGAQQP